MNKKGQITLTAILGGLTLVGSIFGISTFFGTKVEKASEKAQVAIDKTAELSASVLVIQNDVKWIRDLLEKSEKQKLNTK